MPPETEQAVESTKRVRVMERYRLRALKERRVCRVGKIRNNYALVSL